MHDAGVNSACVTATQNHSASSTSSSTHRRSSLRSAGSCAISDSDAPLLKARQPKISNSAANTDKKTVSISAQRKYLRSNAELADLPEPEKSLTVSSVPANCRRSSDLCAASSRTNKKDHSARADETSRKKCELCLQPANIGYLPGGKKRKITALLLCGSCEDAFHSSCLLDESDISAVDDNGDWICPICFADSELKIRSRIEQIESNRPCRAYSSAWLKTCCTSHSLGSSGVSRNLLLRRKQSSTACAIALNESSRSLVATSASVARGGESLLDSSLPLSGLCKSVIQRASLKLPRYQDRSESQRADARQKLFSAMKEKGMVFQDGLSYDWPDCPQVRYLWFI